jgi:site-specific DNA-methyltransferase (adenine-specific)
MQVNEVYEGDCLDVMREFPDNCIDSIITDPPYGLEFMGKDWDYGIPGVAYWREALRIAKPGATLMAFGGTRTYHRLVCAIEDAGWGIRDCTSYFHDGTQAERAFMASLSEEQLGAYLELHHPGAGMGWVYGSGIGLGHNVSKGIDKAAGAEREVVGQKWAERYPNGPGGVGFHGGPGEYTQIGRGPEMETAPATPLAAKFNGWNTRLKPAHEPIVLAMKPIDGTFAANAEKWGVSGLNIDGGRVETNESLKGGAYSENGRVKPMNGDSRNGTSLGMFQPGAKPKNDFAQPKGRFPANVIHDGSEEVMAEFDKAGVTQSSNKPRKREVMTSKGVKGGSYGNPLKTEHNGYNGFTGGFTDSGTPARFFAQCPPDPTAHPEAARFHYCPKAGKRERGNGNNHPTVKPLSLLRYLARLTRPPDGGIVLDPFGGSGTTALACIAEGRDYIIIEKEPEYAELCRRRIAEYSGAEVAPVEHKVTEAETVEQMSLW